MKLDIPVVILLILAAVVGLWFKPWEEGIPSDLQKSVDRIVRIGKAVEAFRDAAGYYPGESTRRSYARDVLGGVDSYAYLVLSDKEKAQMVEVPDGKKIKSALTLYLLDPLRQRFVYRVGDGGRSFVLYSIGPNGRDELGKGDDVLFGDGPEPADPQAKTLWKAVARVGKALVDCKDVNIFFPPADGPRNYGRAILGGARYPRFLDYSDQEEEEFLVAGEAEFAGTSSSVDILDLFGEKLIYRRDSFRGPFQLYSSGPDRVDNGGWKDDIGYQSPHLDEAYWNRHRRYCLIGWGIIGGLILIRLIQIGVKKIRSALGED